MALAGGDQNEPKRTRSKRAVQSSGPRADELAVFGRWMTRYTELKPKAKTRGPLRNEQKTIRAALASGLSVEDAQLAIDGLFLSDYHTGENETQTEYLGIHLALKPENIDKFRVAGLEQREAAERRAQRAREEERRRAEDPPVDLATLRASAQRLLANVGRDPWEDEVPAPLKRPTKRGELLHADDNAVLWKSEQERDLAARGIVDAPEAGPFAKPFPAPSPGVRRTLDVEPEDFFMPEGP